MEKYLEMAKKNKINVRTFKSRLRYGWGPRKAATKQPFQKRHDNDWRKVANKNGVSNSVFYDRVDNLFWSPEEAAITPIMSRKEVSDLGNKAQSEYREITNKRIYKDPSNMFKLTLLHIEEALKNGIKERTVRARVYNYGWSVQEAITVPTKGSSFERSEDYFYYLKIAKENGISTCTYRHRAKRGWSLIEAATAELVDSSGYRGEDKVWFDLAIQNGIKPTTYKGRIRMGWSPKEAATTPILKKGEYLNQERKNKAADGYKNFKRGKNGGLK
ncbi:hypothetical protein [Sutcliffiella halmapala]|uniref:hypothetical protein n=1 Tax=Sutcliffiella halmapala TaxID=79882 RepID=UPI000995B406|nr:hypothetical protein [Sutcliffiella halmapala]